jgi:hypothetical protein
MTTKLNAAEARGLSHFHAEKGDMTRSVCWAELKPQIRERFPQVLDAMERLASAQRTLDAVVIDMVKTLEMGEE